MTPTPGFVSMASNSFRKFFQLANCGFLRRSAAMKETDATTPVGSVREQYDKPRTMASAAQEMSSDYRENEVEKRSDEDSLSRGRKYSPLGILGAFNSFFPNGNLLSMICTMNRIFDESFFTRPGRTGLASSYLSTSRPPWDFKETEDSFRMRIDLPGLSKEEVIVNVEDGNLIITGEHKDHDNKKDNEDQWSSRSSNSYSTRIFLPDNANTEQITAELTNGELLVSVPKIINEPKKNVTDIPIQ